MQRASRLTDTLTSGATTRQLTEVEAVSIMETTVTIGGAQLAELRRALAGPVYLLRISATGDGRVSVKANEGAWSAPVAAEAHLSPDLRDQAERVDRGRADR